ncbi:hypothetical protein LTR48_003234 [Friedmanniomyces endolithicus]|uniref:Uncharacterized protein n=1 Tax=Rachicladosporium monterosium TaxID=1507873 RepID=A0ABR0L8A3_9PEZI|nr:hypothetical protein LTR48_003234 [Friedmanniomyces endolithicus]KAK1813985.1 hypothetical protein LTR12_011659 [Friedmanniomyces endolithicus]KAK5144966.1 hypothetical protein LTR32_003207 [Rachicladosporium monterosium]
MSGFGPYVEDDNDAFDPGPAFEHGPGMMGPPMRPGDFDAEASRGLTPPTPSHSPHQPSGLDDEPPHATEPFSNDLYDDFARDRAGPPWPMSPAFDPRASYAARGPHAAGGNEGFESSAGLRSGEGGEPFGLGQVREGSVFHRAFVREGFGGPYAPGVAGATVAPGESALEGEEEDRSGEREGSAGGYGSGWSGH